MVFGSSEVVIIKEGSISARAHSTPASRSTFKARASAGYLLKSTLRREPLNTIEFMHVGRRHGRADEKERAPQCVRCELLRGIPARESRLVEQVSVGVRERIEAGVVAGINSLRYQRQESDCGCTCKGAI
jgi:hypothetical protein